MRSFDLQLWARIGAMNSQPLTRPADTLSHPMGRGTGWGRRFMGRIGA